MNHGIKYVVKIILNYIILRNLFSVYNAFLNISASLLLYNVFVSSNKFGTCALELAAYQFTTWQITLGFVACFLTINTFNVLPLLYKQADASNTVVKFR